VCKICPEFLERMQYVVNVSNVTCFMMLTILFQCLSSTVGFGFGCSYIARYEEQGIGSQWSNINSSPIPEDDFSLLSCMWVMLIDSAIYLLITWYVEAVFPGWFAFASYFCIGYLPKM